MKPLLPATKGMTGGKKLNAAAEKVDYEPFEPPAPSHHDPFAFCVCAMENFLLVPEKSVRVNMTR